MSVRKAKLQNNENKCPLASKRFKTTPTNKKSPFASWKLTAAESSSSPSALPSDYLDEMGVGVLDSEESTSSAASIIALADSISGDENSNEATPNLDAPKFCPMRLGAYRSMDSSLDESQDNNNIFSSLNETLKATVDPALHIYVDEPLLPKGADKLPLPQQRKVAILGAGACNLTSTAARNVRSPLAQVTENSFSSCKLTVVSHQQPPHSQIFSNCHLTPLVTTSESIMTTQQSSTCIPSTSQQAARLEHLQKLNNQQQQVQQLSSGDFFLYRNTAKPEAPTTNHFNKLSDEIVLHIFKFLPKKGLLRCCSVSRRFNRCGRDESLWARLDLGSRVLRAGALEQILPRGVVILRLAQAQINHPVFGLGFMGAEQNFVSKLQYLDLSMAAIEKSSLKMLLARCRHLKKLSLELVPLNDEICNEIAKNTGLEALNLAMCTGLEAWNVRKMMEALTNLNSLNISWTNLSADAVTSVVTNVAPNLMRLNIAGCRKTMFDLHLGSLVKRCPQLLELDLSDCTGLTGNAICVICNFKMLEYLSLSRCYLIPAAAYMELSSHLPTLTYLDVFGMLTDAAMEMLEHSCPSLGINKFIHSSVARPTVGTRRTSIWGLRTRD